MAEVTREGFRLKKILIEDWKKAREEKQKKLIELQAGKKSLEDQVEMLRTVKEEAEKPEKEAKEQHQKLWEGMAQSGPRTRLQFLGGRGSGPRSLLLIICCQFQQIFDHGANFLVCLLIFDCVLVIMLENYRNNFL
nr:glucosidase 2 subunit beta-like [Aotus nancymaae]